MGQLANGDRTAVATVFHSLWPAMRMWCRRWLPAADADDAAQQAMLKLFAQSSSFDRDGDALSWALSVATWECKTIRKRHARRSGHETDVALTQTETPESLLLDAERLQVAELLLKSVDADERALLDQLFVGERTAPKSAAVRKRKQRVLERVRAAWRKLYGPTY
jgi:RNA polymerase sigma-70 factor (ECF subfamily)